MNQKRKRSTTASITEPAISISPVSPPNGDSPKSPPPVTNRTAFFAFGRFQPVTRGHAKLFDVAKTLADNTLNGDVPADFFIVPSATCDPECNPLTLRQKLKYMRKAFPQYTILNIEKTAPQERTAWGFQKYLLGKGYTNITWVVGSDRHKKLKPTEKPGERSLKFATSDALIRDPKSTNPLAKVSGTLLREYAEKGDFARFKEMLAGTNDAYKKDIFNKIKAATTVQQQPKKRARKTSAAPTTAARSGR